MDTRYPIPCDPSRPFQRFVAPGGAIPCSLGTWVPIEDAERLAERVRMLEAENETLVDDLQRMGSASREEIAAQGGAPLAIALRAGEGAERQRLVEYLRAAGLLPGQELLGAAASLIASGKKLNPAGLLVPI